MIAYLRKYIIYERYLVRNLCTRRTPGCGPHLPGIGVRQFALDNSMYLKQQGALPCTAEQL